MSNDWGWLFASEGARARMMRDEIDGLQGAASVARAQSARLSSQLAGLQGSMETRLNALAAAFDAYVELGDVREQLAGYPDTAAIRRDVRGSIQALGRGELPDAVDDRGQGYWLSYALNALIGTIAARPDAADEVTEQLSRAVDLSRDAELFVVAAAGALGHGDKVGGRVAALLICDGELTPAQLALWRGVRAGGFGPILSEVLAGWDSAGPAAKSWTDWVKGQAHSQQPNDGLRWLTRLITGEQGPGLALRGDPSTPVAADQLVLSGEPVTASATPAADPREALRAVVGELVSRGLGDEIELLERTRVLRARIEDPGASEIAAVDEQRSVVGNVIDEIRAAVIDTTLGRPERAVLLDWSRAGLLEAVAELRTQGERARPEITVQARTPSGVFEVGVGGADLARLAGTDVSLRQRFEVPMRKAVIPGVIAGVLVVAAVVGLIADVVALTVLSVIAAVVLGVFALLYVRERRLGERQIDEARTATSLKIEEAQQRARELQAAEHDSIAETGLLATALTAALEPDHPPVAD